MGMHDHIEEMGKNIVRRLHPDKPYKHSRLWIDKEIEDIMANDLGTEETRYIRFTSQNLSPEIVMKGLRKMKELRFLDVSLEYFDGSEIDCSHPNWKFDKYLNSLRYLYWDSYPFRSLPDTFEADNLVSLKLFYSNIIQLWEGRERKVLNKLRFLDLSCSMLRTFDIGLTPNLETLTLKRCRDLVELHMLDGCLKLITVDLSWSGLRNVDLGSAVNLELLDLERCLDLVELNMPGRSPNMSSIKLGYSKLRTFDIGLTPNLEYLDLGNCLDLKELHMGDECQKLTFLNISHSKLRNLDFRLTPNLEKLDLRNCYDMKELHMAHEYQEKLVYLDLSGCLGFTSFKFCMEEDASCTKDDSSCGIGPLAELHLSAKSLNDWPVHLHRNLPKFQFTCFYKEDKPLLTRNLEKLIYIGLCTSTNLDTISKSICGLQRLRKLKLEGSILEAPKALDQLECLEELDFSCTKIKLLPNSICMLKHLESLYLSRCSLLEKLPEDLGRLESLKNLTLSYNKNKSLPDSICMLKRLESLKLDNCSCLEKLPKDLGRLESLKNLTLSFTSIKDLPDSICMLKHLKSLELDNCSCLEKLPTDFGRLESLANLTLSYTKIKDLPDSICMLKHLKSIDASHCSLLETLPEDLGRLECLENLNLCSCRSLREIPNSICKIKCLKLLSLSSCIRLEKLPEELGRIECLENLFITSTSISHLPRSIFMLKRLHIFASRGLLQSCGFTSQIQTSTYKDFGCVDVNNAGSHNLQVSSTSSAKRLRRP